MLKQTISYLQHFQSKNLINLYQLKAGSAQYYIAFHPILQKKIAQGTVTVLGWMNPGPKPRGDTGQLDLSNLTSNHE